MGTTHRVRVRRGAGAAENGRVPSWAGEMVSLHVGRVLAAAGLRAVVRGPEVLAWAASAVEVRLEIRHAFGRAHSIHVFIAELGPGAGADHHWVRVGSDALRSRAGCFRDRAELADALDAVVAELVERIGRRPASRATVAAVGMVPQPSALLVAS